VLQFGNRIDIDNSGAVNTDKFPWVQFFSQAVQERETREGARYFISSFGRKHKMVSFIT
jgi:hypothetical protein